MADFHEDGGVMCDNRAKSLKTSKKSIYNKDLNWNIKGWLYDTNMMKFCAIKK